MTASGDVTASGPGRRRWALLVSVSSFDDSRIRALSSPPSDVTALEAVLGDPLIGDFAVSTLTDPSAHEMRYALERFYRVDRRSGDLLLIYYSGHGLKHERGTLHFAARDTDVDALHSTSVAASFVNDVMEASPARTHVVLLDCCHSGAFSRGLVAKRGDRAGVLESLGGRGRVVITSSDALQYSFEEGTGLSTFTRALTEGLASGHADRDRDGIVSVDDLYDYLHDRLADEGAAQTPTKWSRDQTGTIAVARAPVDPGGAGDASSTAPTAEPYAPSGPAVRAPGPGTVGAGGPRRRQWAVLAGLGVAAAAMIAVFAVGSGGGESTGPTPTPTLDTTATATGTPTETASPTGPSGGDEPAGPQIAIERTVGSVLSGEPAVHVVATEGSLFVGSRDGVVAVRDAAAGGDSGGRTVSPSEGAVLEHLDATATGGLGWFLYEVHTDDTLDEAEMERSTTVVALGGVGSEIVQTHPLPTGRRIASGPGGIVTASRGAVELRAVADFDAVSASVSWFDDRDDAVDQLAYDGDTVWVLSVTDTVYTVDFDSGEITEVATVSDPGHEATAHGGRLFVEDRTVPGIVAVAPDGTTEVVVSLPEVPEIAAAIDAGELAPELLGDRSTGCEEMTPQVVGDVLLVTHCAVGWLTAVDLTTGATTAIRLAAPGHGLAAVGDDTAWVGLMDGSLVKLHVD